MRLIFLWTPLLFFMVPLQAGLRRTAPLCSPAKGGAGFGSLCSKKVTSLRAARKGFMRWVSGCYIKCIGQAVLNRLTVCAALCFISISVSAQDSVTVDHLLDRIETQQLKKSSFFMDEIFPSYISSRRKFKTRKEDNTIFYNALIVYTLKENRNKFSAEQKITCDSIIEKSVRALPKFKNKKRNTYNFWRTDTAFRFPYSWWLPLFRGKTTLPDDMDDTVLGLMMLSDDDSAEAVHALMQWYINSKPPLKTTYRIYANDSAYSTWFGKKVPVVFDVSVLCNVLSFVQKNNLQWTKADSASLQLIVKTIQRNDEVKHPSFVSPYYGNTSIILYHLARLMSIKPIAALEALKPRLIELAQQRLQSADDMMEKIILSSALLKWGVQPPELNLKLDDISTEIEKSNLPFFIGNIPSYFKQPWKEKFISFRLLMYNHYCPAYNDALLIEYLILKNNF